MLNVQPRAASVEVFSALWFVGYLFDHEPASVGVHVPDNVRLAVLVRDGHRCRKCRGSMRPEIDHVVTLSKDGSSEESNLQVLCRRCNRRKWNAHLPRLCHKNLRLRGLNHVSVDVLLRIGGVATLADKINFRGSGR